MEKAFFFFSLSVYHGTGKNVKSSDFHFFLGLSEQLLSSLDNGS
jgi:hypothetical protein